MLAEAGTGVNRGDATTVLSRRCWSGSARPETGAASPRQAAPVVVVPRASAFPLVGIQCWRHWTWGRPSAVCLHMLLSNRRIEGMLVANPTTLSRYMP